MPSIDRIFTDIPVSDIFNFAVWGIIFLVLIFRFFTSIKIVPTQAAYVVERLGKYNRTLGAGFHALIPFVDKVSYQLDLKELTVEVPPQECFTADEVRVEVDGVMYISVIDSVRASYGVTNYGIAAMELAQTTTRSVIGTLDLDKTFEERALISARVVEALDAAGKTWGIRVHRYEIKNLTPPPSVHEAMEKQVTAERERRAIVARSEGEKQSRINTSEGEKMEAINLSEGQMQRTINEAEGQAQEILSIAEATANSIEVVAAAIESSPGGDDAIRLQLAERYLQKLTGLAQEGTRVVLPTDMTNIDAVLKSLNYSGFSGPAEADG
ncbi:MAG: SPFH/Band 7/PHB domain protein [Rhodospirillaceae bacterium]|jgi:regulator of protease activity HflC (stomatin/prohibitin superfamily)|nr:SPFH/Band 7/PHB domain protein [Rhodospirillaceae bacterium]MBT3885677.1 SPFH/Band 7/PHB domain protein [Rhodospirillaceae bacterium]MBT4118530.1 SPFH/Band 7/PHB domain protein [Rhodospirillaceae bacterium]MBT4670480.1 SPFH/Band 7/PHB domain protein [Rhodospirillaceae bacterium]MBT4720759.1 SPFH/Band 7/PHB domain protein [Rhodospirillaceae bacterium]